MTKISLVVADYFANNRLFDPNDPAINRDDCMLPLQSLRQELKRHDIEIGTQDVIPVQQADLVIFSDMPAVDNAVYQAAHTAGKILYVIVGELGFLHPPNLDRSLHGNFQRLFTYQDDLVDGKKYIKCNYSFRFPDSIPKDLAAKEKLCTLIAANKTLNHPQELYSKRHEAIRWFERHHPEAFDLYGHGWDQPAYIHGPRVARILNRSVRLRRLLTSPFSSYRGTIQSKFDVLKRYKFAISYENARDVPGWITEKVFHCFFAGCVPVYWGANNVTDHIPANCFIDKRQFATYEKLYSFLATMDDRTYLNYIEAIGHYLRSDKAKQFSIRYFAETIAREVCRDLQIA